MEEIIFWVALGEEHDVSCGQLDPAFVAEGAEPLHRALPPHLWQCFSSNQAGHDGTGARLRLAPGDFVRGFTDGIGECRYRKPATSVQPHHIVASVAEVQRRPSHVVTILARQALGGVGANLGGQANIAVIAAITE